ncbi:hypothetical protein C4D60_Mb10t08080 [Musa balbisiana]|uniref:Uncharacterized protein n=1 Tax=Musa balbisiana TaxID=52838 RepID=A0A4S8IY01_MUSBA|nr:hypothetical protein C4D60_Mb10t08080 [Musa balbisiana]
MMKAKQGLSRRSSSPPQQRVELRCEARGDVITTAALVVMEKGGRCGGVTQLLRRLRAIRGFFAVLISLLMWQRSLSSLSCVLGTSESSPESEGRGRRLLATSATATCSMGVNGPAVEEDRLGSGAIGSELTRLRGK